MSARVDHALSFHRPRGISCSHYRRLVKERVAYANANNCKCEHGCQPALNEGLTCWRSGHRIPVGYFDSTHPGERGE